MLSQAILLGLGLQHKTVETLAVQTILTHQTLTVISYTSILCSGSSTCQLVRCWACSIEPYGSLCSCSILCQWLMCVFQRPALCTCSQCRQAWTKSWLENPHHPLCTPSAPHVLGGSSKRVSGGARNEES